MLTLLNLLSAVALLIWGTHIVRTGILRVYGSNLRHVIGQNMSRRGLAFIAGIVVTAMVQSSNATAMLVTSFVGQGLMALTPALATMLGADVGKVIMYGLIVALPTAVIAGPLWVKLVCKPEAPATQEAFLNEHCEDSQSRDLPGLGITLLTIALPLLLMVGKSFAASLPHESTAFSKTRLTYF